MISIPRIGLGLLAVACASFSLACSSSSSSPAAANDASTPSSDDSATPPAVDSGGSPGTDATTGEADAGTGTDSGPAPLSCIDYCSAVMSECTGPNAQYESTDACMNACPNFPVGTAADTSGNTLGCRTYHAALAKTATNPHCWHAGPYGYGGCGTECEGFCTLATTWCTPAGGFDGGAPPYTDDSTCLTACAGFARIDAADGGVGLDGGYTATGPAGGNTLDCREYHLTTSLAGGAMQQYHCMHPGVVSATCN